MGNLSFQFSTWRKGGNNKKNIAPQSYKFRFHRNKKLCGWIRSWKQEIRGKISRFWISYFVSPPASFRTRLRRRRRFPPKREKKKRRGRRKKKSLKRSLNCPPPKLNVRVSPKIKVDSFYFSKEIVGKFYVAKAVYIFDCSLIVCRILCHHFSSSSAAVFLWWRPTVAWAAPHLTPSSSHSCLYYQEGKGGNRSVFAQLLFPSSLFKKKLESVSIKTAFVDFLVLFACRGYILVVGKRNKLIFGREGGQSAWFDVICLSLAPGKSRSLWSWGILPLSSFSQPPYLAQANEEWGEQEEKWKMYTPKTQDSPQEGLKKANEKFSLVTQFNLWYWI